MNWPQSVDNLFSANHRNLMIQYHGGTMAQLYTVEELINYVLEVDDETLAEAERLFGRKSI